MLSNLFNREPVLVMTVVQASIALVLAFGVSLTPAQIGAIVAFSAAVLGLITRSQVTPSSNVALTVDSSKPGAPGSKLGVWLILVLAGAVAVSACASLPLKQQAVVTLAASESALEAAHDFERSLCSPTADKTKAITHCDGAGAASLGLTDAKHQQLARLFSSAFGDEQKASAALKAWQAGAPAPSDLAGYQQDIQTILALVGQTFPQTHDIVVKAQEAVDDAAKVATTLGVK